MENDLADMFDVGVAAMDGVYGWLAQTSAIIVFVLLFNFVVKALLLKFCAHLERKHKDWESSFVRALYRPLSAFVWLVAVVYAADIISHEIWETPPFPTTPHFLLKIGAILAFSWFLFRWNSNVTHFMTIKSKRHQIIMDQSKIDVISKLISIVILFVTVLLIMEVTGQSMQTLIAFGGIGGLALAFASQEVISNFFGGLMIYFTHPFTIGDWIKLPEKDLEGHVEEIGWYMTLVRNFEKRPIYVPNSTFSKVIVINPSRMTHRQIKEKFGIRYSDRPALMKIIQDLRLMLSKHPDIDQLMTTMVHFSGFGDYSLDIEVSTYTQMVDSYAFAGVKEDVLLKIGDVITANGAELAFSTSAVEISGGITLH